MQQHEDEEHAAARGRGACSSTRTVLDCMDMWMVVNRAANKSTAYDCAVCRATAVRAEEPAEAGLSESPAEAELLVVGPHT